MQLNVFATVNCVGLESALVGFLLGEDLVHCEGFVVEHYCFIGKRVASSKDSTPAYGRDPPTNTLVRSAHIF